eukprot:6179400-Pleurochrysis_carterae.AAC.1
MRATNNLDRPTTFTGPNTPSGSLVLSKVRKQESKHGIDPKLTSVSESRIVVNSEETAVSHSSQSCCPPGYLTYTYQASTKATLAYRLFRWVLTNWYQEQHAFCDLSCQSLSAPHGAALWGSIKSPLRSVDLADEESCNLGPLHPLPHSITRTTYHEDGPSSTLNVDQRRPSFMGLQQQSSREGLGFGGQLVKSPALRVKLGAGPPCHMHGEVPGGRPPPSTFSSSDADMSRILTTISVISPESGSEQWNASSNTSSASLTWKISPAGSASCTLTQFGHPNPTGAKN